VTQAQPLWRSHLYSIACFVVPVAIYAVVLTLPLPEQFTSLIRENPLVALIAIPLLLYPAYRRTGYIADSVCLGLTLVVFALPLSAMWNSGITHVNVVFSGLFPMSDARTYYQDAKRLLAGDTFGPVSSYRPLSTGVLSTLLGLTDQNLQVAIAILVALTTLSCFLLAREVQRNYGLLAGLTTIAVLFLYYRCFIGTVVTENWGIALGAISFAVLLRAASRKNIVLLSLGIFLLTLAMSARAGALFVLPLLVLWGGWHFRGTGKSLWVLAWGWSAIALGFALNHLVLIAVGNSELAFSNFSYVFYATVVGSKSWLQVTLDHPEILVLDQPQLTQRIYELAFEALQKDPFAWVSTALEAVHAYLRPLSQDGAFALIQLFGRTPSASAAIYLVYGFGLIGLLKCFLHRKATHSLVLVVCLGILLSLPLAPPWISYSARAYAATFSIYAVLPAIGISSLFERTQWNPRLETLPQSWCSNLSLSFALLLVLLTILGPLSTRLASATTSKFATKFSNINSAYCDQGEKAAYIKVSPGAFVNLVADDRLQQTHLPDVRLSDFRSSLKSFTENNPKHMLKPFEALSDGVTVMSALDWNNRQSLWIIANSKIFPRDGGLFGVCGTRRGGLMYVNSFHFPNAEVDS